MDSSVTFGQWLVSAAFLQHGELKKSTRTFSDVNSSVVTCLGMLPFTLVTMINLSYSVIC